MHLSRCWVALGLSLGALAGCSSSSPSASSSGASSSGVATATSASSAPSSTATAAASGTATGTAAATSASSTNATSGAHGSGSSASSTSSSGAASGSVSSSSATSGAASSGSVSSGSTASSGGCPTACDGGQVCTDGACACPSSETACPSGCADLSSDPLNCDTCGNACGGADICHNGACECLAPDQMCNSVCTDVLTDSANCGLCGTPCPTGTICAGGACTCATAGDELCDGTCLDPQTDPDYCGHYGADGAAACEGGATCVDGGCACPAGSWPCDRSSGSGLPPCTGLSISCVAESDQSCSAACLNCQAASATCQAGGCVCNDPTATYCAQGGNCLLLDVDSRNCGGCGTPCVDGGLCSAGSCAASFVNLAPNQPNPQSVVVSGGIAYWADRGLEVSGAGYQNSSVMAVPVAGGAPVQLASSSGSIDIINWVAVDSSAIYWNAGSAIMKAQLDGGSAQQLSAGLGEVGGIGIDSSAVYWTTTNTVAGETTAYVMSVPLDGGATATLATDAHLPAGQALGAIAVSDSAVYWIGQGLQSCLKDGGSESLIAGAAGAYTLAIDSTSAYWLGQDPDETSLFAVVKVALDGGSPVVLASGPDVTAPTALALDSTAVYWISLEVYSVGLEGGTPVGLLPDPNGTLCANACPYQALATDGTALYATFGQSDGELGGSPGGVMRLDPK